MNVPKGLSIYHKIVCNNFFKFEHKLVSVVIRSYIVPF